MKQRKKNNEKTKTKLSNVFSFMTVYFMDVIPSKSRECENSAYILRYFKCDCCYVKTRLLFHNSTYEILLNAFGAL